MLQAALLLGFFGFLHISEFTTPSGSRFNPRLHAAVGDVHLSRDTLTFHLKRSKTDQLAKGSLITLGATTNSLCLVAAMKAYLATCQHTNNIPLFHTSSANS